MFRYRNTSGEPSGGPDGNPLESADSFERVDDVLPLEVKLGLIDHMLPPAAPAHPRMAAAGSRAERRGLQERRDVRLGELFLRLYNAHPGAVTRDGPMDEDHESLVPPHTLPLEREPFQGEIDLLPTLHVPPSISLSSSRESSPHRK